MAPYKTLFIASLFFLIFASSAPAVDITVTRDETYQKMDGVGANCYAFAFVNDMGWDWNKVKFVFDELNLEYIRLVTWFDLWEPQNDDADPYHFNWSKFDPTKINSVHDITMIKFLKGRGYDLTLGIWKFGSWLAKGTPKQIEEKDFPELGESIAAYLVWLRDKGYPVNQVEVQNEPDFTADVKYSSPEKLRKAAVQVIDQLDRNGLDDISLYLPDLSTPKNTAAWGEVLLADPKINERTEAVSYHTWWVDEEKEYRQIWDFAQKAGKPVWATEVGYCALPEGCFGGTHFLRPETWGTAWDYAMSHYRAIAWSHASRVYHWSLLGHDSAVGKQGEKYPSFYILKHFANYIPKNAFLINSEASDSKVLTLVFEAEDEELSAILINAGKAPVAANIKLSSGEHIEIAEAFTTNKGSYMKETEIRQNSHPTPELQLPPESITSLKFVTLPKR